MTPTGQMKKIDIMIEGRRHQGAVAVSGSTTWYSLGGEVWTVETESSGRLGSRTTSRSGRGADQDASLVSAPMPGKIIKVFVAVGDAVEVGQTLVIMEAMKMEYTLKAAARGKVQSVHCVAGDQVALGSSLIHLEVDLPKKAST